MPASVTAPLSVMEILFCDAAVFCIWMADVFPLRILKLPEAGPIIDVFVPASNVTSVAIVIVPAEFTVSLAVPA